MKRKERMEKWAENYPEVKRWLAKIQMKEDNVAHFHNFCEWANKTPPELLRMKTDRASTEAEELLDDFVANEETGFPNSVKWRMTIAVKSFFKHNYRDLAKASGKMTLDKVKPYNKPRKEDLRKLWLWMQNPRDKSLITFICSTAIAKETITKIKWKHLQENWETVELPCIDIPDKLLKGHGIGKYKGVRQITFLTPEAKRDLLVYKEWMEQKIGRKLTNEDNIFLSTFQPYEAIEYSRLGNLIWKVSRKAGVHFSWHDARRYVNTALEEIRIPLNWARKIRGRKVKGEEAPYSLPAIKQLREKFKEAVPILQFTSEKREIPKEVREKLAALEEEQKKLKMQWSLRKPKAKPKKSDCTNGEHCEPAFKEISESELLSHLQDGWQIAHSLQNGRVIVKR
jgi:hypothetical protein